MMHDQNHFKFIGLSGFYSTDSESIPTASLARRAVQFLTECTETVSKINMYHCLPVKLRPVKSVRPSITLQTNNFKTKGTTKEMYKHEAM